MSNLPLLTVWSIVMHHSFSDDSYLVAIPSHLVQKMISIIYVIRSMEAMILFVN